MGRKTSKRGQSSQRLPDSNSYAGQQKSLLRLEGVPQLLSTTTGTGVISDTYIVEAQDILAFATRFGNTFDEYRILGADIKVTCTAVSTGVSKFWFDEKSNAVPTLNESQERTVNALPNNSSNSKSCKVFRWRARDLLDLQFSPISTLTVNPVTFKIYTNNANYGAPTSVTPLWLVESVLLMEFRGIASS